MNSDSDSLEEYKHDIIITPTLEAKKSPSRILEMGRDS